MPRAVALLDILGFRRLVETVPIAELSKRYEDAISNVDATNRRLAYPENRPRLLQDHRVGDPWAHRQIFSDSIIVVALDETADSCLKLLLYARHLFQALLAVRLPLRGAVAVGDLYYNERTGVVLGKALTEAYALEQEQDWVGGAISDSVWQAYPELRQAIDNPNGALNYYFLEYAVPMKSGQRRMRILNWRFNLVSDVGSRGLLDNARVNESEVKYRNTILYLEYLRDLGALYFGADSVPPAECNMVWIGRSAPPFEHGDDL